MRAKKICIRNTTPMIKKSINICVFKKSSSNIPYSLLKSVDISEDDFKNLEINDIIQDLINEKPIITDNLYDSSSESLSNMESQPITISPTNVSSLFDSLYRCFDYIYNIKNSSQFTDEFNTNIVNHTSSNTNKSIIKGFTIINSPSNITCEISRNTILNEYTLGQHIHLNSLFSDYCDFMDKNLKITITIN